jgi:hypothetical protein
MPWDWLNTKRLKISKTFLFSWPDASRDICMRCAKERRFHDRSDNLFVEKKEK